MSQPTPHYRGTKITDKSNFITEDKGKGEWIIDPQALDIIWGGDDRYWKINKKENTVELVQVCWLEVTGSFENKSLEKNTSYTLEFDVELKSDAFGWNNCPVYLMVKVGEGQRGKWKKFDLNGKDKNKLAIEFNTQSAPKENDNIIFGLYEIWTGRWKGGLKIKKVRISKNNPPSPSQSQSQ